MTRILLAVLLTALAGAAAAQTVTVTKETGEAETLQTSEAETDKPRELSRTCLRGTGSRITLAQNARAEKDGKPQRCAPAFGRVYTREDLDRTGQNDIYDALRMLDPSIR